MFHVKHPLPRTEPAVTVSRETSARLDLFVGLLAQWSKVINLVALPAPEVIWRRHINDSLQLLPLLPSTVAVAIDLGSGAGFPGLVLAVGTGCHFHLVEADRRKAAFLREAARLTAASVTVHDCRIERAKIPAADLITARALAPLPRLLELAVPHLAPSGTCLFLKGRRVSEELTAARRQWHMRAESVRSLTDPASSILKISEIARVRQSP